MLKQLHIVDKILYSVGFTNQLDKMNMKDIPAVSTRLLDVDIVGAERKQYWNYRSVVSSLEYLQCIARLDITMAVEQYTKFCNNPKASYEEAVKHICKYLLKTQDMGLLLKPDKTRGLECYVDADWARSWIHLLSHDPMLAKFRTG